MQYVWVFWDYGRGCRRPSVDRYELVKVNPKGSVTVKAMGGVQKTIPPMRGKEFFTDKAALFARYNKWMTEAIEYARSTLDGLIEDYAQPDMGMLVEEVSSAAWPVLRADQL